MKNKTLSILFLLLQFSIGAFANNGTNCIDAIDVMPASTAKRITLSSANFKWLKYNSNLFTLVFYKSENPNVTISGYQTYSGACSALSLVKSDTNRFLDSTFNINTIGENKWIKINFYLFGSDSIKLLYLPKNINATSAQSVGCQQLINNGDFQVASGPTDAAFWYVYNNTPQYIVTPANSYYYMWAIDGAYESIFTTLNNATTAGSVYKFSAKIAFVKYTGNAFPIGVEVPKFVAVLRNSITGASQVFTIDSNIINTSFNTVSKNLVANGVYNQLEIYPYEPNLQYCALKVDDISLRFQAQAANQSVCLGSTLILNNYNCNQNSVYTCTNVPSAVTLVNGVYNFSATALGNYTISSTNIAPAQPYVFTITVVNPNCAVNLNNLPSNFCLNNYSPVILTGYGSPTGGLFSGPNVSTNQYLNQQILPSSGNPVYYSYTCSNGCLYSVVKNINYVNPIIIPINTPATICTKNAPINLFNYVSITNGTFSGTGIVNNIFDPALAGGGTFTISYNYIDANGCDAIATKVIQVILPTSGLTISSVPTKICNGTTATLTVSGGAPPYNWNTMPPQTGSSIIVNIAQTYSVYSIFNGTCLGGSINLVEGDLKQPFVSGNTFACDGQTVNLQVTSPAPATSVISNVIWFPNNGTCTAPCTNYSVVMPSTPVTYNVYPVTASGSVCLGNSSIALTPILANQPFCCSVADYVVPINNGIKETNLSSFITGATITNKIINIPANTKLIIDYPVTLSGCTLRCAANATIKVNNVIGAVSFTGCVFYACGDNLWNGIALDNKRALVNFTNCSIEDAGNAVNVSTGNFGVNFTGNTFNKNGTSIFLAMDLQGTPSYPPISFSGNQFTSVASTFSPGSTLKKDVLGYSLVRSFSGITIFNSNLTTTDLSIQFQIGNIGITNKNTFNNLTIGIETRGTNRLKIINNDFIDVGTGIDAVNYDGTKDPTNNIDYGVSLKYFGLEVGGTAATKNTFTNNYTGIKYTGGYASILANVFNNPAGITNNTAIKIINDVPFLNNSPVSGSIKKYTVTTNAINNYTNGIQFNFTKGIGFNTSYIGGGINAESNTINGGQSLTAIDIQNLGTSNTAALRPIIIKNNNLLAQTAGVNALDVDIVLSIDNNTINNGVGISTGIYLQGCDQAKIRKNTITSSYTGTNYGSVKGIRVRDSKQLSVQCNTISKQFYCMMVQGNCVSPGLGISYNKFLSGAYGFVLNTNGEIGTQAYTDPALPNNFYSCENTWGAASAFTNAQTATINTLNTNTNSKMYLRAAIKPTVNLVINSSSPTSAYNSTGLPTGLTPTICDPCDPNPVNCSNNPTAAATVAPSSSTTSSKLVTATSPIVNNTANYAVYNNEQKLRNKKAVYELIAQNPTMKNTAAFNTFYTNNKTTCIGKLTDVEDLIATANYTQAKTLNTSFTAGCAADADLQNYYTLYLKYATDTLLDSNNYAALLSLANHCADQVGIVVYKARGLYDVISKQKHNYADNCAGAGSGNRIINTENTIENKEKSTIKEELAAISLYPNPNNGNFILNLNTNEKLSIEVSILDLNGKVVLSQTCVSDNGKCEFNANQLQKGFYTVKVNNEKSLKLLIK
jgi:Secretion system C-terminal sorting domain